MSAETTPTLEVATAIRMSMSIPLFFQAIPYDGNVFCDGGVIANYPINLFAGNGAGHFATLGLHLYTPATSTCSGSDSPLDHPAPPRKTRPPDRSVTDIVSYIEGLFESLLVCSSAILPGDVDRTVNISNYCVGTTDFSIAKDTADYNGLFNNGYAAIDDS